MCENHIIYYTLASSGTSKSTHFDSRVALFFLVFLKSFFGMALGTHFDDFGSLLGSRFEAELLHFQDSISIRLKGGVSRHEWLTPPSESEWPDTCWSTS